MSNLLPSIVFLLVMTCQGQNTTAPPGESPVPLPTGETPVAFCTGETPVALCTGETPVALCTGETPVPLPTGETPVVLPSGECPVPMIPGEAPVMIPTRTFIQSFYKDCRLTITKKGKFTCSTKHLPEHQEWLIDWEEGRIKFARKRLYIANGGFLVKKKNGKGKRSTRWTFNAEKNSIRAGKRGKGKLLGVKKEGKTIKPVMGKPKQNNGAFILKQQWVFIIA
eukprot:GFUD01007512.1.p1 GENE.GFUD01007512.1~~GFUD01007512.1.p1  ORF type:complete len:224 (+),score=59.03 GFUD01007512.1:132-803(+)